MIYSIWNVRVYSQSTCIPHGMHFATLGYDVIMYFTRNICHEDLGRTTNSIRNIKRYMT
jgi:hypothetical protein